MSAPKPAQPATAHVELTVSHTAGGNPWHWTFSVNEGIVKEGEAADQRAAFAAAETAYRDWLKHQP